MEEEEPSEGETEVCLMGIRVVKKREREKRKKEKGRMRRGSL